MARGGKRENAGRKPKADEQQLVEMLTPMLPVAKNALENGLHANESWAVKLYFEYLYGKPRQSMDITSGGDKLPTIAVEIVRPNESK